MSVLRAGRLTSGSGLKSHLFERTFEPGDPGGPKADGPEAVWMARVPANLSLQEQRATVLPEVPEGCLE